MAEALRAVDLRSTLTSVMRAWTATGPDPVHPTFDERMRFQRLLNREGLAAPGWPTEFGGRGASTRECLDYDTELARIGAPLPAGILGLANVGPALCEWGTTRQQESLPRILDGSEVWCQGFSEPGAGSDLAHLRTTARLDGRDFVVNGQKVWTSNGMDSTHCMLLARTDPHRAAHDGISVLLVPLDSPGITRAPIRMASGDTDFAEIFFTDVRVARSAVLGPLHGGWRVTTQTLKHERAGVLSRAAALAANARRGLGDVMSSGTLDAIVADDLVQRYVEARVLGLLGSNTLAKAERGLDIGSEQALIKLAWGLIDRSLAQSLFDAREQSAAAGEFPHYTQQMLYTKASTIAAGTTEILKNLVAERVLALPR